MTSEFDVAVSDLMEKNGALTEEVKNLKIEKQVQLVLLYEVTK
jgi:hypothetical protein